MPKVYPDISTDQFNTPIAPRLVLASDVLKITPGLIDGGRTVRQIDGSDTPVSTTINTEVLGDSGCGKSPDDMEITVSAPGIGDNVNTIADNTAYCDLPRFKGWPIKAFRNNIPMENLDTNVNGFRWNARTGRFYFIIPPREGEIFTFQVYSNMIDYARMGVLASGENKNNIIVDNGIVFLTIFVNTRIRVFRNNILQSFITDFSWDNEYAKLTLNVNPAIDEEFYFESY